MISEKSAVYIFCLPIEILYNVSFTAITLDDGIMMSIFTLYIFIYMYINIRKITTMMMSIYILL